MNKPFVKICGITNFADALFCASAGADFLGFIFYPKSPRFIDPAKAQEIIKKLPKNIIPVGVFVNETSESINRIASITGIQIAQLSGDEPPELCESLSLKIWKGFRLKEKSEIEQTKNYSVSAFLLDGVKDGAYGGTGTLADFSIALEMKTIRPLVLAGGLSPDNIQHAISSVQPYAVDINSGVEFVPGKKDHQKIKLLFENITRMIPS